MNHLHVITPAILDIEAVHASVLSIAAHLRDVNPGWTFDHWVRIEPYAPQGAHGTLAEIVSAFSSLASDHWMTHIEVNKTRLGAFTNIPATCVDAVSHDPDGLSILVDDGIVFLNPVPLDDLSTLLHTHRLHLSAWIGDPATGEGFSTETPFITDRHRELGKLVLVETTLKFCSQALSLWPNRTLIETLRMLPAGTTHIEDCRRRDGTSPWTEMPQLIVFAGGDPTVPVNHMACDAPRWRRNMQRLGQPRDPSRTGDAAAWREISQRLKAL